MGEKLDPVDSRMLLLTVTLVDDLFSVAFCSAGQGVCRVKKRPLMPMDIRQALCTRFGVDEWCRRDGVELFLGDDVMGAVSW